MQHVESNPQPAPVDLSNCADEPIHAPGRIQPHGVLIALAEPDLLVDYASVNAAAWLGIEPDRLLGATLAQLFGTERAEEILSLVQEERIGADATFLFTMEARGPQQSDITCNLLAHRFDDHLILEIEPAVSTGAAEHAGRGVVRVGTTMDGGTFQMLHGRVRASLRALEAAPNVVQLCQVIADEVRRLTKFPRVMIYQFAPDWHGRVVAESNDGTMETYLHHQFPASDIPAQARELYRLNRVRLIADVNYRPVELLSPPQAHRGLDMSFATLRSVSPIHLEYLRNMNCGSSMSVSILRDGKLWGLIACHDRGPRFIAHDIRSACDHLGQIFALQLAAKEQMEDAAYRLTLADVQTRLLSTMAANDNFVAGLVAAEPELLKLTGAGGAAICVDREVTLLGRTPSRPDVEHLLAWLEGGGEAGGDRRPERHGQVTREIIVTDSLVAELPEAARYADAASGVLAISVPRYPTTYVIWFRPEVLETIVWAGNPAKPAERAERAERVRDANVAAGLPETIRIHPRKSFEAWKQVVRDRSVPWRRVEVDAAAALRDALIGIVLRKAEELSRLNADLRRINAELEAFSYSVSHDLRAPFRHIVGYSNLLKKREEPRLDDTARRYIDTIAESARYAGSLVDGLLAFSQMGRKSLSFTLVDLNLLFQEVRQEVATAEGAGRDIDWRIGPMPRLEVDATMLRLAVRNLLSNAVKYSRTAGRSVITIAAEREGDEYAFSVGDNGVGFDMAYADKLFGVFQRLHRAEEFEGTGIGLANVRRIIDRHGGRTWARGEKGRGATFYFTLPIAPRLGAPAVLGGAGGAGLTSLGYRIGDRRTDGPNPNGPEERKD